MGTRGIFGLRKNGKDKCSYNHWDSYPSCLGETMVEYIQTHTLEEMNNLYDKLIMVDEDFRTSQFTKFQREKYKNFMKKEDFFSHRYGEVCTSEDITMYQFLHEFQGNLKKYDEFPEIDLMIDSQNFIKNSLFCEWGYIINLDDNTLEIWKGFQQKSQKNNRYGCEKWEGYYPSKNIKKIKLEEIKKDGFSLEDKIKKYYD